MQDALDTIVIALAVLAIVIWAIGAAISAERAPLEQQQDDTEATL